jgi:hypothetical protein
VHITLLHVVNIEPLCGSMVNTDGATVNTVQRNWLQGSVHRLWCCCSANSSIASAAGCSRAAAVRGSGIATLLMVEELLQKAVAVALSLLLLVSLPLLRLPLS